MKTKEMNEVVANQVNEEVANQVNEVVANQVNEEVANQVNEVVANQVNEEAANQVNEEAANSSSKDVMKYQRELNNDLKEEHKSFTSLVKTLEAKKNSESMKNYLNAANLTFEQLTNIDYFKTALTYKEFEINGKKFEHIARKNKEGVYVMAKWSFWLIMNAAKKVRREELAKAQKAAQKAKETSLAQIEKEEKDAKK